MVMTLWICIVFSVFLLFKTLWKLNLLTDHTNKELKFYPSFFPPRCIDHCWLLKNK